MTSQVLPADVTVPHMEGNGEVTVRELPAAEWELLRQIPEVATQLPDPRVSTVIVAQDTTGKIVGYCFMYIALHIGPFEIVEEHRKKPGVLKRIWRGVGTVMERLGYPIGYAMIMDYNIPSVGHQATRLGFHKIAGSLYYVVPEKAPHMSKSAEA